MKIKLKMKPVRVPRTVIFESATKDIILPIQELTEEQVEQVINQFAEDLKAEHAKPMPPRQVQRIDLSREF